MATAEAADVTFLTNAKNAANSSVLPGAGPEAVGVWIDVYSADDTLANLHSLMEFFPSALEVGAKAGYSVSNELLCGASASGTSSAGVLTVTLRESGDSTKSYDDCIATTPSPASTFRFLGEYSESANDEFGQAVAAGDFNDDGIQDLAVSARYYDTSSAGNVGAVYVFYGGASFVGKATATESADAVFIGKAQYDNLGFSVASGDFNGDGVADLVVGATGNDDAGGSAGAAYVIPGSAGLSDIDFSA